MHYFWQNFFLKELHSHPRVSVVILNWNGKKFLEKFLPSVVASGYENLEIVVADNGSADGSVACLQSTFPAVRQIQFSENLGFAKGYNEALKKVSSDYYILLNSDVEVIPGWIQPMVQLLEADRSIAACQPRIRSFTNRNFFDYAGAAGGWIDKYGYPFAKGRIFDVCEADKDQYNQSEPIFWASGACMCIRASVFHELKGFDEYFFAHQEEIDLCWRIQLSGYKIFSCPASVVYHVGGGTLPRGNSLKTYLNFRNNLIMLYKNWPPKEKWWKIPYRIFLDALSAWKGLLSGYPGYFLAILRAHTGFAKWIISEKNKSVFPEVIKGSLHGLLKKNLVWEHFVKKKKYFSEIVRNGRA